MEKEKVIEALKICKVYLASLNMGNDIVLNSQLLDWFIGYRHRFQIFKNGMPNGFIYYSCDKIKINIADSHDAIISLDDHHNLKFCFKNNMLTGKGNFFINNNPDIILGVNGKLDLNSQGNINFAINNENLFDYTIENDAYLEKLIVNLNNYLISYNYNNKDERHKTAYEASVNGIIPCMLQKPSTFITNKQITFNGTIFTERKYHQSNQDNSLVTLMTKLYPEFSNSVSQINDYLLDWFPRVFALAYPNYSSDAIKKLLGITKKEVLIDNKSFLEFMNNETIKQLKLERR